MSAFVTFKNVKKVYQMGEVSIEALRDATFEIEKGEICVIVGASGAGKTTLLNILGGMDTCDEGKVRVGGKLINKMDKAALVDYRRYEVGFVFQFYNLVPNLTALENVELATQMCKKAAKPEQILEKVGLKHRLDNFPSQLSGGEQQRVSIARALAKKPALLLCDEPTGALDYKTSKQILSLLHKTCRETGTTVVVITHNQALAAMADRIITMRSGRVVQIAINERPVPVEHLEW